MIILLTISYSFHLDFDTQRDISVNSLAMLDQYSNTDNNEGLDELYWTTRNSEYKEDLIFNRQISNTGIRIVSNEDFIDYLNNHFVPEIDLGIHNKAHSVEITRKTLDTIEAPEVNLSYRGQKNNIEKGKFAERNDVILKTLMRTIRRFFWEIFKAENEDKNFIKRSSHEFNSAIVEFYNKHLKPFASYVEGYDESMEKVLMFYLSTLMTNHYIYKRNGFSDSKRILNLMRSVMKTFSNTTYSRLFRIQNFKNLILLLKLSGLLSQMIEVYPKLKLSREAYEDAIQLILS